MFGTLFLAETLLEVTELVLKMGTKALHNFMAQFSPPRLIYLYMYMTYNEQNFHSSEDTSSEWHGISQTEFLLMNGIPTLARTH